MLKSEQNRKLRHYVRISLGLHAGFFALLLIGKFFGPPPAELLQPSVQIDMVALPDLVKSQNNPALDKTLPVKEAPPPPPPPPPKEEEAAPAPEPAKPDHEKELALKREKEAQSEAKKALERLKAQKKKEERAEQKRREELANQREQDLKRFEEAYRSALKGNQVNQGTSATGAMQEIKNAYAGHIRERLQSNWALPAWLQGKGLRARVLIYLDGRGNIARSQFLQSSGNDAFDGYVKETLQRSSPFNPPPEEMARGLRNSGLEVQFPL
jgi:TonB family protein